MNPPIELNKCAHCERPAVLMWVKGALCALHRHLFAK